MNVRFLADSSARALHERYGGVLSGDTVLALSAAADARLLVLPSPLGETTLALLRDAGVVFAVVEGGTLLGATRASLQRASQRAQGSDRDLIDLCLHALDRACAPAPSLRLRERTLDLRAHAQVMAVIDGDDVADGARRAAAAGAALVEIDLMTGDADAGDDATRVAAALAGSSGELALAVRCVAATRADAALAGGAHLILDPSGLADQALHEVIGQRGAGLVVTHVPAQRRGDRRSREDALRAIIDGLYERTQRALREGVTRDAIAVDPGVVFGCDPQTDLAVLERFGELTALGYPILFASAAKPMISALAAAAVGIAAGARLLRVHDVAETVALARVMAAVTSRGNSLAIEAV